MPANATERAIHIELERCVDCSNHSHSTRHEEARYERREMEVREAIDDVMSADQGSRSRCNFVTNPCQRLRNGGSRELERQILRAVVRNREIGDERLRLIKHNSLANTLLFKSYLMDQNTRKWFEIPGETFRYPRLGAFEVHVRLGTKRVQVHSKLESQRWPNCHFLAERVRTAVEKLGGWSAVAEEEDETAKPQRTYTGFGGKATVTDEELRKLIAKKFSTINTAFRSFDKNGDGRVNKQEFMKGIRGAGIDVPEELLERLWATADEDNNGTIVYLEFARRFCSFKASHSLHRHSEIVKDDAITEQLHGSGHARRTAKHTMMRERSSEQFSLEADKFNADPSKDTSVKKVSQMASLPGILDIPIEKATLDELRAQLYHKHGNLMTAFRHFDISGDSRISWEEWCRFLPKAVEQPVSEEILDRLWQELDKNNSGSIDLQEFTSDVLFCKKEVREIKMDLTGGKAPAASAAPPPGVDGAKAPEGNQPSALDGERDPSKASAGPAPEGEVEASAKPAPEVEEDRGPSKAGTGPTPEDTLSSTMASATELQGTPQAKDAGATGAPQPASGGEPSRIASKDDYSEDAFEASGEVS